MNENQEQVQATERSINELIDLPYSEMTTEEIDRIIEFKAAIKARDEEHVNKMQLLNKKMEEIKAIHMESARNADNLLNELTAHAIEQYKAVSNGQA